MTGTTVLVVEDVHWADEGLLDFLETIPDRSRGFPILVVTLSRPELLERRPGWGTRQRTVTAIHLEPIDEAAARAFVTGLAPSLPDALVRTIVERSAGIPLFAVELVRALTDQGVLVRVDDHLEPAPGADLATAAEHLGVPGSMRSLIASRLDGLPADERATLQDASVLGLSFLPADLAGMRGEPLPAVEARLDDLCRREFLAREEDPRSPERGQVRFLQGVVREVAYETLAKRDRRARHQAVARQIEASGDESLATVLAAHQVAAWELSAPGPERDAAAAQARVGLRAAAARAQRLGAHGQALAHLEQALMLTDDPSERAELDERAATAALDVPSLGAATRHARAALADGGTKADSGLIARMAGVLAEIAVRRSTFAAGVEEAKVLRSRLDDEAPAADVMRVDAVLSRLLMLQDENEESLAIADRALAVAEHLGDGATVAHLLSTKANVFGALGRTTEARALAREAFEIAFRLGALDLEVRTANNYLITLFMNDPAASMKLAGDLLEQFVRTGSTEAISTVIDWAVASAIEVGDWDAADRWLERPELDHPDLWDVSRAVNIEHRATLRAMRGDVDEASRLFEEVRVIVQGSEASGIPLDLEIGVASIQIAERMYATVLATLPEATGGQYQQNASRWSLVGRAALGLRDVTRLEEAIGELGMGELAHWASAMRVELQAGLAAITGRPTDALAGFHEARSRYRALHLAYPETMAALEEVELLGASMSAAELDDAVTFVREFCERNRAVLLLRRLEVALVQAPV